MIPNQRHLFDIPKDVTYLNCAFTSPLMLSAREAGREAIEEKRHPWTISPGTFIERADGARGRFAELIGADSADVAVIPAVSYGTSLAAKNVPVEKGQTIIVLEDQFPSHVYPWRNLAAECGAEIVTVARPHDGDWTPAVLDGIDDRTAAAALPNCHWTDGTLVDLKAVGEKCRQHGAALVVDATQSLGALPLTIKDVQPDFLVAASHKWLLGAYSFGFCYVAPKWQNGTPLEENWFNRAGSENFARLVDYRDEYQPGARRFDMGEVSNFMLAPIAKAALNQILEWSVENIAATLKEKTDHIVARAVETGMKTAPAHARSPHMLGLTIPGGMAPDFPGKLAEKNVYVSVRGSSIRVSPHLYNTREDVDRLFDLIGGLLS